MRRVILIAFMAVLFPIGCTIGVRNNPPVRPIEQIVPTPVGTDTVYLAVMAREQEKKRPGKKLKKQPPF